MNQETDRKTEFYKIFLNSGAGSNELQLLIRSQGKESGFFEICQAYCEIALNAWPQVRNNGSEPRFSKQDVENAIELTLEFCSRYQIEDIGGLMDGIRKVLQLAYDPADPRGGGVLIKNPNYSGQYGVFGTYLLPTDILTPLLDKTDMELRQNLSYHNTNRLDVDGVVKKIMGTDYVKEELEGRPHAVEA